MSAYYRPTPVFNPGPPRGIPLSGAVSGGEMHGYADGVNWKGFFDAKRAATQGKPWIVRSGSMGAFLAQDDGFDYSNLPLSPVDTSNFNLSPMLPALPVDFYPMPSPIDPSIAPFNPGGISEAPIISSGGSILSPRSPSAQAATPWASIVNSLTSFGSSVVKAASGQPQINPAIPPVAPTTQQSLVASAQSLQAQANALQASNPALAAQYRERASSLLSQAGSGTSSFANWMSAPSSLFPSLSNGGFLTIGVGAGLLLMVVGGAGFAAGRRR